MNSQKSFVTTSIIICMSIGICHCNLDNKTPTPSSTPPTTSYTMPVRTNAEYTLKQHSFVSTSRDEITVLSNLLVSGNHPALIEYINTHDSAQFVGNDTRVTVISRTGGLTGPEYVQVQVDGLLYWTVPEALTRR